jgi:hypothetical protein
LAAVSGFRLDVDWLQATTFEIMLFNQLVRSPLDFDELASLVPDLDALTGYMADDLGFTFAIGG